VLRSCGRVKVRLHETGWELQGHSTATVLAIEGRIHKAGRELTDTASGD
jgi:hypothetical protein